MKKTTNQRRTAGSILEGIQKRLDTQRDSLQEAEKFVVQCKIRVDVLESLLADSEKNGSDDEQ